MANYLITGSNNVALGYQALTNVTNTMGNNALGLNALGFNVAVGAASPEKLYYVLSCKKIKDKLASIYCSNINAVSLIVYNGYNIKHHVKILPISVFDDIRDGYSVYTKIIPKWITLYLSLEQHFGQINNDIFTNVAQYYIGLYHII